jgi:hypothetical protein
LSDPVRYPSVRANPRLSCYSATHNSNGLLGLFVPSHFTSLPSSNLPIFNLPSLTPTVPHHKNETTITKHRKTARVGILLSPSCDEQNNKKEKPMPTLLCERKSSESCRVLFFSSLPFLPPPSSTEDFLCYLAFSTLCASSDYTLHDLRAQFSRAFVASPTEVHEDFVSSYLLSSSHARYASGRPYDVAVPCALAAVPPGPSRVMFSCDIEGHGATVSN